MSFDSLRLGAACFCAAVLGVLAGLGVAVPIVASLPYDAYPFPPSAPPAPPNPPEPPSPPSLPPPPSPIAPVDDHLCSEETLADPANAYGPTSWLACQAAALMFKVDAATVSDTSSEAPVEASTTSPSARGVCVLCSPDRSLTFYVGLEAFGSNASDFCATLEKELCHCVCPA